VSGIRGKLCAVQGHAPAATTSPERIIAFSRPVFEYIHWHQGTSDTPMMPRARALLHQRLRSVLAESIAAEIRTQRKPGRAALMPPELLAEYVAATFIVVLDWWLQKRTPQCPNSRTTLSCGLPIVEIQCSAKPRAATDCAACCRRDRGYDQSVVETLMVALCVIVVHVFGDGTS
jgi:hypothetical protein